MRVPARRGRTTRAGRAYRFASSSERRCLRSKKNASQWEMKSGFSSRPRARGSSKSAARIQLGLRLDVDGPLSRRFKTVDRAVVVDRKRTAQPPRNVSEALRSDRAACGTCRNGRRAALVCAAVRRAARRAPRRTARPRRSSCRCGGVVSSSRSPSRVTLQRSSGRSIPSP